MINMEDLPESAAAYEKICEQWVDLRLQMEIVWQFERMTASGTSLWYRDLKISYEGRTIYTVYAASCEDEYLDPTWVLECVNLRIGGTKIACYDPKHVERTAHSRTEEWLEDEKWQTREEFARHDAGHWMWLLGEEMYDRFFAYQQMAH